MFSHAYTLGQEGDLSSGCGPQYNPGYMFAFMGL